MTSPHEAADLHIKMPPILRRAAARRPAGPSRQAILRLADELETKADVALISHRTMMDAIEAYVEEDRSSDIG